MHEKGGKAIHSTDQHRYKIVTWFNAYGDCLSIVDEKFNCWKITNNNNQLR